jgi:hypothetical protein
LVRKAYNALCDAQNMLAYEAECEAKELAWHKTTIRPARSSRHIAQLHIASANMGQILFLHELGTW